MTEPDDSVLIAFDGSKPALEAVEQAACLFPGRPALIATAWRSVREAAGAARAALPNDTIEQAIRNLDAAAQAEALATAEAGAQTAQRAGMDATPLTVRAEPSVWASLVDAADEHDARAVIVAPAAARDFAPRSSAASPTRSFTTAAAQ